MVEIPKPLKRVVPNLILCVLLTACGGAATQEGKSTNNRLLTPTAGIANCEKTPYQTIPLIEQIDSTHTRRFTLEAVHCGPNDVFAIVKDTPDGQPSTAAGDLVDKYSLPAHSTRRVVTLLEDVFPGKPFSGCEVVWFDVVNGQIDRKTINSGNFICK